MLRITGCLGLRDGPDVQASLGLPDAFGDGGAGFPGEGAGCPGLREEPDVPGDGRMSGLRWTFAVLSGWPMPDF